MPVTQTQPAHGLGLRIEGPIAFITIDNTAELNRLSPTAIAELGRIAEMLRGRDDLHVVVIRGAGREYFSTGILNPVLRGQMSKEDVAALVMQAADAFDAIDALPQIVIAGLNGIVRAGGVELALACDIRIAADHVRMSLPEAQWGGFPGAGGPLRLARLLGRARALELICTGREIDSAQMETIGLVQKVTTSPEFDQALRQLAEQIASSGPLAVRGAKEIVRVSEEPGFKAARKTSDTLRRKLEWSEDVDESIRAHREGRKPKFVGR